MSALAGQHVVVVGGSSGIGLAAARQSAAAGARVAILGRSQAKLDAASRELKGSTFATDMLDAASVDRTFAALGAIDHLVLTAVSGELESKASIAELTNEQLERTFDKLRGFVNVIRASAPALARNGSITIVTGASAVKPPRDGFTALAAASSSLLGFGKALALELAPTRVNVVMAGVVDTAIHAGHREETKAWAERDLLVKRFGQPDDLAGAIVFLMTNPYVTASTLTVDGGFVAV